MNEVAGRKRPRCGARNRGPFPFDSGARACPPSGNIERKQLIVSSRLGFGLLVISSRRNQIRSDLHLPSGGGTIVRSAVIFLVVLLGPLSLSAACAGPLSLYGPFDQVHNGARGDPAPSTARPPSIASGDILGGCGRGRYRESATQRCRGPADLR
jgi:hypothetical protein